MSKHIKQYDVEGMHCASCVTSIETSVGKLENIKQASVNLATNTLQVEGDFTDEEVIGLVEDVGYKAKVKEDKSLH